MKIRSGHVKTSTNIKPKKNITLIVVLGIVIIGIAAGIFYAASSILKTQTYWVLNQNVTAKTQITPSMLEAQKTANGTAPKNAIGISQVQQGTLYAKYPLYKGDVLSKSNAGADTDSIAGIPDSWVVTSFQVKGSDAVDGLIKRGSYFDLVGVGNSSESSNDTSTTYEFVDLLALDVTTIGDSSSSSSDTTYSIKVGLPPAKAAKLQAGLAKFKSTKLFLAPADTKYKKRATVENSKGTNVFVVDSTAHDMKKGTDATLTPKKRDSKGRPVTTTTKDKAASSSSASK